MIGSRAYARILSLRHLYVIPRNWSRATSTPRATRPTPSSSSGATYARVDALARDGKCAALDRARFMYSWFLPCYAVKELYGQGVRIVADPQIHGKIRLHTGGGTPGIHLLEAHPPFTATRFLDSETYDASIHAPPDDGFSSELKCHGSNRRSNGYCGPWRYAHSH